MINFLSVASKNLSTSSKLCKLFLDVVDLLSFFFTEVLKKNTPAANTVTDEHTTKDDVQYKRP